MEKEKRHNCVSEALTGHYFLRQHAKRPGIGLTIDEDEVGRRIGENHESSKHFL